MAHNHRVIEEEWYTANRTVHKRAYLRRVLGCDRCPPNKGENARRIARHDRYKSARKGRCSGPIEPPARYVEDDSPVPKYYKRIRVGTKRQRADGPWWNGYLYKPEKTA